MATFVTMASIIGCYICVSLLFEVDSVLIKLISLIIEQYQRHFNV